jgi:hypothetical protein
MQIVTELKNQGVQDIFIACVDGFTGFPEAIEAIFPKTGTKRLDSDCSLPEPGASIGCSQTWVRGSPPSF